MCLTYMITYRSKGRTRRPARYCIWHQNLQRPTLILHASSHTVKNELSHRLTSARDSIVGGPSGGVCSGMFSDAMELLPNFVATSLYLVLLRLQHNQPTLIYHSQLLRAPHAKFQSNQPITFLATEINESTSEQALYTFL